MEYYFEVLQTDIDPETSLELQEIIRLRVKDEKEAIEMARVNARNFPPERYSIKVHEHDHKTGKACKTTDLRSKI